MEVSTNKERWLVYEYDEVDDQGAMAKGGENPVFPGFATEFLPVALQPPVWAGSNVAQLMTGLAGTKEI